MVGDTKNCHVRLGPGTFVNGAQGVLLSTPGLVFDEIISGVDMADMGRFSDS